MYNSVSTTSTMQWSTVKLTTGQARRDCWGLFVRNPQHGRCRSALCVSLYKVRIFSGTIVALVVPNDLYPDRQGRVLFHSQESIHNR